MKYKYITPPETSFLILLSRLVDTKGFRRVRCQNYLIKSSPPKDYLKL